MKIFYHFLYQNLGIFDILHAFIPLVIAKLWPS